MENICQKLAVDQLIIGQSRTPVKTKNSSTLGNENHGYESMMHIKIHLS
jgi:hypothetical protein